MEKVKVKNVRKNQLVGDKIEIADSFFTRLKGLLGKSGLEAGEGLILVPCSSIHCIGMKFAIDVIFMDIDRKVIWIRENMKPGTKEAKRNAYCVLEVASGVVQEKNVQIGDVLGW